MKLNLYTKLQLQDNKKIKKNKIDVNKYSINKKITRSLSYFFRKGNKEIIEKNFRNFIIKRSNIRQFNYNNYSKIYNFKKKKRNAWSYKFQSFFNEIIPYVDLKSKQKKKIVKYKVSFIERSKSQRKALYAFSSSIRAKSTTSKSFADRFPVELDKLYNSRQIGNQKATNNMQVKVGELHRQALKETPYYWQKKYLFKKKKFKKFKYLIKKLKKKYMKKKKYMNKKKNININININTNKNINKILYILCSSVARANGC